jgi:hypothetical protein
MMETSSPATRAGLARYFLRLGALGFGGPIALVGHMHRDLVERRGWVSEDEYREGLALAQLSPGPLAAQLCFYLGYIRGGIVGAALSGHRSHRGGSRGPGSAITGGSHDRLGRAGRVRSGLASVEGS